MQRGADVLTHIDIGDVDGKDFVSRTGVKTFLQYEFGDRIRIFQNFLVRHSRTDARHDAFAHAGKDSVLACTTYELVDIGTHRDAGLGDELDTVFGNGGNRRRINDFGINGGLHGFEHVATGEVNSRGLFKREVYVGFRRADKSVHHALHVAAGHIVRLEVVARDVAQPCLVRLDEARHDDVGRHVTDAHQEELQQRDVYARHFGGYPKEEGYEVEENGQ